MPVQPAHLDILIRVLATRSTPSYNAQINHADRHVSHVQSGEAEERRPEERVAPRILEQPDALVDTPEELLGHL